MIILGIETSCDETALALLSGEGGRENPLFNIIAEALHSQVEIHQKFGGVFPMMAKREHTRNLVPLFKKLLMESGFLNVKTKNQKTKLQTKNAKEIEIILNREPELLKQFIDFIPTIEKPGIDAIAVTQGPGLEPALWVGINFAKALGVCWGIPVIPINHMEGHIFSVLLHREENPKYLPRRQAGEIPNPKQIQNSNTQTQNLETIRFPALALLISGGHTELVLVKNWLNYQIIGETRDDAVGEAFDKVARILGLPYPGGPSLSALAERARNDADLTRTNAEIRLPRPMLHSENYDFSFSGLKTAVLYMVKKIPKLTDEIKNTIAREFEDAVTDVLVHKTKRAIEEFGVQTLIVAGGVSANRHLREVFARETELFNVPLLIPDPKFSTDNAVMIATAGYFHLIQDISNLKRVPQLDFSANGTLKLGGVIDNTLHRSTLAH